MKPFKLGTYFLELCNVEVWVNPPLAGGSFQVCTGPDTSPRITLGFNLADDGIGRMGWVMGVLLHETIEFLLYSRRCRFATTGDQGLDHAEYTFHFDHPIFSHVCAAAGDFIEEVRPALEKAHKGVLAKWRKEQKTKKK